METVTFCLVVTHCATFAQADLACARSACEAAAEEPSVLRMVADSLYKDCLALLHSTTCSSRRRASNIKTITLCLVVIHCATCDSCRWTWHISVLRVKLQLRGVCVVC
jgi:hypothetical protein